MKKICITMILFFCFTAITSAQESFPEKCLGIWKGQMFIYKNGHIKDSVEVKLSVTKTEIDHVFGWKTEYLSIKRPIVKDYKMRSTDSLPNTYILDEGDGIELKDYLFGNKLYGVFETSGFLLTSSYELIDDKLIFEVTSGKMLNQTNDVNNYSVDNLQRVVFKRED